MVRRLPRAALTQLFACYGFLFCVFGSLTVCWSFVVYYEGGVVGGAEGLCRVVLLI